ncbi:hypothetical protein EC973_001656 [Apophysomyces ossiformis]|uniref:Uncharacterized protein n=1 Tax=Apophysomyces ossiformis TaxID=679940 RepID=A0A8H7ETY3_9FUNG|nr:hypothetical protein EC973_001656 [Apophysomyces ossiformis]
MSDCVYEPRPCMKEPSSFRGPADEIKMEPTQDVGDKSVVQLLTKLEEGTQTIANLRSILTMKTAELNELIAQLEMTNQAITHVESTTAQIETMLKDLGLTESSTRESLLLNAEASLDSAIKSASSLYATEYRYPRRPSMASTSSMSMSMDQDRRERTLPARFASKIRYKPDPKRILRQINDLLRDLELEAGKFYESMGSAALEDIQLLQKAYVDLDLAKTIALSAKSNMKRRTILLRSSGRRRNGSEEIKSLGIKIREGVAMWKNYTRDAPMLVDGKDIIEILDQEDELLAKNLPVHSSRISIDSLSRRTSPTPSLSGTTRTMKTSLSMLSTSSSSSQTSHSRRPSIAGESLIPAPIPTSPPAVTNVKKIHRQTGGGVRSITMKSATGGARVRTSSATNGRPNSSSSKPLKDQTPPATPSPPAPAPVEAPNSNHKKSMLKPPTQRGPGSTLRIRSMLAKRHPSIAQTSPADES